MADITSILTIMGPGGLACGTLLDLRGDVMEFEISADLQRGFESDWRMELRGTTDSARGRLRVDEARARRDGIARYTATILHVQNGDRAAWDAWRARGRRSATPLRIEDPLAVTPRMASARETEAVLRKLDARRPAPPAATVLSTPLWARTPSSGSSAPAGVSASVATVPTPSSVAPPVMQARTPIPAAVPSGPSHPGVARHKDTLETDALPDIQLQRRTLPERDFSAPKPVQFRVEQRTEGPTLFWAVYSSPLRYRTDFREQMQWGALLIELPHAAQVGLDVELRIVTPDGRDLCVPANVLTASARSTCVAIQLSPNDITRLAP